MFADRTVIIPDFLTSLLKTFLSESRISANTLEDGIRLLRHLHRQRYLGPVEIPYDHLAVPFLYKYFASNFASTFATLAATQFASRFKPAMVCDFGAGSGASTAAFLLYLDSMLEAPAAIKVIMFDRSAVQCQYAERVVQSVKHHCKKVQIDSQIILGDIRSVLPTFATEYKGSIWLLAAFVLNELGIQSARDIVRLATSLIDRKSAAGLLVVEQRQSFLTRLMEFETDTVAVEPSFTSPYSRVAGAHMLRPSRAVEPPKSVIFPHGILFSRSSKSVVQLQASLGRQASRLAGRSV